LIAKPNIETQEQLQAGKMKFALWDITLSISLFTTILGLLSIYNSDTDLTNSLSAFSSQFILLFEFGYYAYFSTLSFFIISLAFMLIFKPDELSPLKRAFLVSLQYARWYALFLFLSLPLLAIYIDKLFTNMLTIDKFTRTYSIQSTIALISLAY